MKAERELLRPAEVASLFGVGAKTVTRWANTGKLPYIMTPGGHRRYDRDAVFAYLHIGSTKGVKRD